MHLIQQKFHRYIGEEYTLTFDVTVPGETTVGDISQVVFGVGDELTIAGTPVSVQDAVLRVDVPIVSSTFAGWDPDTYIFDLSMVIDSGKVVVARGVLALDRSVTLEAPND